MHNVKRAIIMAAGIGKRMNPITLTTPKPLVTVSGVSFLDSIIQALHINDIFEIYIVVGYKKEKFDYLRKESGITLIYNPDYSISNNISSLYFARDYLEDSFIIDGDQLIKTPSILKPSFEKSGYNAVWADNPTSEWLMQVENNRVISCSRTGGSKGWQLFSISRWTSNDGQKLRIYLEKEYTCNHNTDIYWDDIALFLYPNDFNLGIVKMNYEDIIEVDSVKELVFLDSSYKWALGNEQ